MHSIQFVRTLRLFLEIVVPTATPRQGNAVSTVRFINHKEPNTHARIHTNGNMQSIQSIRIVRSWSRAAENKQSDVCAAITIKVPGNSSRTYYSFVGQQGPLARDYITCPQEFGGAVPQTSWRWCAGRAVVLSRGLQHEKAFGVWRNVVTIGWIRSFEKQFGRADAKWGIGLDFHGYEFVSTTLEQFSVVRRPARSEAQWLRGRL